MESGYGKYPQSVKDGLRAEARFDGLRGKHVVRKADPREDKVEGWDQHSAVERPAQPLQQLGWSFTKKNVRVGVHPTHSLISRVRP